MIDPAIVGRWSRTAAQKVAAIPDAAQRGDTLIAEADASEMDAMRRRQAENRHIAYLRRRPSLYATASYAALTSAQNPQGMISTWWDRGPRSLTLVGPTRTGKTTASYAITNDVHQRHGWVVAWSAVDLSAALKPDGDPLAFEHAAGCELLLVDDLGRERVTDWWLEQLQRLVDGRRANERRLVVTTNSTPDPQAAYEELAARYGAPIAERLIDDGGIIVLDGPAHRRVVSSW